MHTHKPRFSVSCLDGRDAPTSWQAFLKTVQKPARYVGHEVNAIRKDRATVKLRMALAFPDVYEVGMSHLGLKILYWILNEREYLAAERVFAPWHDMEELMHAEAEPLRTLESGTPLAEFDLVGFSLQYELCATTVLQMLQLGGIPIRWEDRDETHPLVIAGGPVVFNPAPWQRFFDACVIGEGEEAILELAHAAIEAIEAGESRRELLARMKQIPGVYVPSLHKDGERVQRRIVTDLERAPFPTRPVLPVCESVHDRIGVEIARGCTRGCRFCQAGILYRPVRERDPKTVLELVRSGLRATGWEEVGLLSLSSGDYSAIGPLVRAMTEEFGREQVGISLPSLRTETLDEDVARDIRKVRKTGFTLAPEAGSERLRCVINKGNTEADLERAVTTAFREGWQGVKLYFMIGLPHETDEDLDGVVGLIRKASKWAKGGKITASVSTFVPKSHTPFQWAEQIAPEETKRRQHHIRQFFRKGRAKVKFHDPRTTFLEGVLARGDHGLADVIEAAYRKGARFDGWDEHFRFDVWLEAFREHGIEPGEYLRARDPNEALPWDMIDARVDRHFLKMEWAKAGRAEITPDCRVEMCQNCGVCDFESIEPVIGDSRTVDGVPSEAEPSPEGQAFRRFRMRYAKVYPASLLGHHDVVRAVHRAFRRAGLKLAYSAGFHPHPKMRFSPPLSVGLESDAEYVDVDLIEPETDAESVLPVIHRDLPEGINPLELKEIPLNAASVSGNIRTITYEIGSFGSLTADEVRRRLRDFTSSPAFTTTVERKGKTRHLDLKSIVEAIDVWDSTVTFKVKGTVNPIEVSAAVLGLTVKQTRRLIIRKIDVELEPSCHEMGARSHEQ